MSNSSKPQLNQSLIDGIMTLQALTLSDEPIGSRDLARRLDMEPTRVNRLLQTLAHIGIARRTKNRKYTFGPGIHALSAQSLFASSLVQNAITPLEKLHKYEHIVALGVLWRDTVTYLYHALPGMNSVEALGRLGHYPASAGGVGMALLATRSDEDIRSIYDNKDIPLHPKGIDSLLEEIALVRKQGYAYIETDEQHNHTIAIAIGNPAHAAIGLSGWIPPTATAELFEALSQAAAEIQEKIDE